MPDQQDDDDDVQNIINGEVPKVSRHNYKKQGTNYSKMNQKVLDITQLKIKLNTLALKLHKEKSINKPLLNKIGQLVQKRTRQPKLEDAYNSLQQIEHNLKTNQTSNVKRPLQNKNYTIKEMKKLSQDSKKVFNVY